MRLKRNDKIIWHGSTNETLKHGQEYRIWKARDGGREVTLKHTDWQLIEPINWYPVDRRFVKLYEAISP